MKGEILMGTIIIFTICLVIFCAFMLCAFMLIFGESGIWWFLGALVAGCAIGLHKETSSHHNNDSYFTDEDFINCKVGEWVSRK